MTCITKAPVTTGMWWVDVPEAGLRILCGCPEDAVKHLMRRGLIRTTETAGVTHETGPNAVLLNDVMLQNGAFTNLAEFPVLQMLYRQGTFLPDHPNNDGSKPLLVGFRGQIEAQMAYIYRGNYGLTTREEIVAAGVPEEQADELYRLKLRFGFGSLLPSEDLVDGAVVEGSGWCPIREGVEIRRIRLNVFEIRYRDESVTVNLNLEEHERHWAPYPLGFSNIKREYFSVIHSGQGDGWDVNRPSMGSVVTYQGRIYLVDAGPNILYSLTALGIGVNEVEGIFHTHCHDDHFAGLTTLMRTDHRIKHFATPLVRASIFKKLAALTGMEAEDFSRYFDLCDLEVDAWNDIGGLEVRPTTSPHPVETTVFTFRIFWNGRYLTYAHLADIAALDELDRMVTDDPSQPGLSREAFGEIKRFYQESVDLKKVDIGGGMIHGKASDFVHDTSQRIVLAHKETPLTIAEKVIGSSAPFGTVDVLVPDYSDNQRQRASEHFEAYFPEIEPGRFRRLLNNPIVTFSPGSVMLKEGENNDTVYLIINGIVEMLSPTRARTNMLTFGSMIGEYAGLHGFAAEATFRSVSYVHALALPAASYVEFVTSNQLFTRIEKVHENRQFLLSTWLFGEWVGPQQQNRIAEALTLTNHYSAEAKELEDIGPNELYLIKTGCVERWLGDQLVKTIEAGDFFGEENLIGKGDASTFTYWTVEPTSILALSNEWVSDIPVVQWKLLEVYKNSTTVQKLGVPEQH